jgi:hypothetical protein
MKAGKKRNRRMRKKVKSTNEIRSKREKDVNKTKMEK